MTRRQFAFWLGFGLFNLAEKLRANCLDDLAAAAMRATEEQTSEPTAAAAKAAEPATHWTTADNRTWRWFERETFIDGKWKVTGITTPINKYTGERYTGATGYLADELVPAEVRNGYQDSEMPDPEETGVDAAPGVATVTRRARHGRPPSRWLRSLQASELRVWLKKIEVPEAGVEGMSYWEHLTRDHAFNPAKIAGLNIDEQAKLHAAAHHGY